MTIKAACTVFALALSVLAQAAVNPKVDDSKVIRASVVVQSPLDTVWWKWTTHDGLKTFFGEENRMSLTLCGPFEIYFSMKAPEGGRGSEGCKVLSYIPKDMLSFSWNAPPSFPDIRNGDHHTWVVVTFTPLSSGTTEVTLRHFGWLEGREWEKVYEYFVRAWPRVLESLEKSCRT